MKRVLLAATLSCVPRVTAAGAEPPRPLAPLDLFSLEYASDPQVSPDGSRVVYVRNSMDVMKDRQRSNLWIVSADGSRHRPLTSGGAGNAAPRCSPGGDRLAWVSASDGRPQVHVRFLDGGETGAVTQLTQAPSGLTWSPDGRQLAFFMRVPEPPEPFVKPPAKPEGAEWAPPFKVVSRLVYRADGAGYLKDGYSQLFVVPADGGAPRQLTSGPFDHRGRIAWSPDGASILLCRQPPRGRRVRPARQRGVRGPAGRRRAARAHRAARARRVAGGFTGRPAGRLPRLRRPLPVLPGDPPLPDEPRRQRLALPDRVARPRRRVADVGRGRPRAVLQLRRSGRDAARPRRPRRAR